MAAATAHSEDDLDALANNDEEKRTLRQGSTYANLIFDEVGIMEGSMEGRSWNMAFLKVDIPPSVGVILYEAVKRNLLGIN